MALALGLRLNALDRLLPQSTEPDNDVAHQVYLLEARVPAAERPGVYARYPLLMADLARLLPSKEVSASDDLSAHMRVAHDVTLRLRLLSALASVGLVLTTWFLARRFVSGTAALLAAFFIATSLLHLLFSQQARPHALHATLASLAVLCALRLRERPTTFAYLLGGISAGLSAACLQSGLATFVPLAAAIVLRERGDRGERRSSRAWGQAGLAFALGGLLVWAFSAGETQPEFDGTTQEVQLGAGSLRFGGHEVVLAELDGSGFGNAARFLWEHDPVLTAAAALGLLVCLPRWRRILEDKSLVVVLAYALPYLFVIGLYRQTLDRFVLPLSPYCACLAGFGVVRAIDWAARLLARLRRSEAPGRSGSEPQGRDRNRRVWRATAIVVGVLVLAFPSFAALHFAAVCRAPDTFEKAADWLIARPETYDAKILVTPAMILPVFYETDSRECPREWKLPFWYARTRWLGYQRELPPSPARRPRFRILDIPLSLDQAEPAQARETADAFLDRIQPRFAVLENSQRIAFLPAVQGICDRVRERGELVWSVESEALGDPRQRPFAYQDIGHMLARLLGLSQLGPRIEIYRMK